ncbi:MAG: hypothetical protein HFF72_07820 [Oscillospiraceae bacterium]|nr:hypothetical protein [Oscillospiraceae bacterium]MCI8942478.1 hypothetical protein [Oscillospiraceae bacterium]
MKKTLSILLIMLLLTACGTKDDVLPSQPDSDPAPQASKALPELEETDWEALSTDAAAFGLSGGPDDPNFEYIFNHTGTVPLDQLVAFTLTADGLSEGATDELYHRFLEAPHKVLAYLVLLDGQITELPGWEPMPAAEIVCQFIATTDAVMYGGTEEFAQTLSACRESYPEGPAAELLDILEREHADALERSQSES